LNGYYAPQTGITLAQGTAAAPSLSFSGDSGTGIFSSGAGVLNLSTGGTSRVTVRSDGDLDIPGSIRKGGVLFLHNRGAGALNTGVGSGALGSNTTGFYSTALGEGALFSHTTGNSNTAVGTGSLYFTTTGIHNTAIGAGSLQNNVTGSSNTGLGYFALGQREKRSKEILIAAV
jgi:hypothetical protein